MTNKTLPLSLHTLPIELVYRILDNLNEKTIILSARNVCTRLNTIIDAYHRYQVGVLHCFYCFSTTDNGKEESVKFSQDLPLIIVFFKYM